MSAMHHQRRQRPGSRPAAVAEQLPLVVSLNCLEDVSLEQEVLEGVASVEHVGLAQIAGGRIESAAAVLVHSLAFLPRAAQRRLHPRQLVLCLGSADRDVDSALAADLGLRLVHVDTGRAEEVADTVMALFLGLLRRTHLLSRQTSSLAADASGWLGSIQPLCRGMRRCRGLVLGIVGRSASARCLATRSLAFRMRVFYFDVHQESSGSSRRSFISFPSAARKMDTLNDLLAASDLISLHCALSDETFHIINAECLQHVKPGAFIVNTSSSQLIDDCALKQLLIDETVAGCALDGVEGPQWMEAWVKEMPNVLILPKSADYSEEVWLEIREKAVSVLKTFFLDGVVPDNVVSDEDQDVSQSGLDEDMSGKQGQEGSLLAERMRDASQSVAEISQRQNNHQRRHQHNHSQGPDLSQSIGSRPEGRHSRSSKKGKKRSARRRSRPESDEYSDVEGESGSMSQCDDDIAISGRDQNLSSSSQLASEDFRNKQICLVESTAESTPEKKGQLHSGPSELGALLKDGYVIALYAREQTGLYVSRQRLPSNGWFLDKMTNVTKRDPAAQFLVNFRNKDVIGLRSFSAGGKLLQINRKMEFVFASHSFDVWESWTLEGSRLEECRLVNCRNPLAVLDVRIEVLAAVGEEDGVARWIE